MAARKSRGRAADAANGWLMTTGQVAAAFGVATRTAGKWVDAGMFPGSYRIPGSKDRRVPRAAVLAFAAAQNMPVNLDAVPTGGSAPGVPGASWAVVGVLLADPVPGLRAVTAYDLAALVAARAVSGVLVGCGEGVAAAVSLAGSVRRADPGVRLGLLLADDVAPDRVPAGAFDAAGPETDARDLAFRLMTRAGG